MGFAEIVATAAVLISAGTLLVSMRRFDHERKMEDRRDARSILAEGALELDRMKSVMKDALTEFGGPLTGRAEWPPPEESKDQIHKLELAAEELESALAAIRIRFQHDETVVVRLESAYDSARSVIAVYWSAYGTDPDRQDNAELRNVSATFDSQKDAYLIAAQKAVGVKLDKSPSVLAGVVRFVRKAS
ncbi:MAG TPA: hypothetical protein VKA53_06635 [Thermoanaerobaculia bacterium]|nr:hypothetical protein [Thermoanaerobaculia bacterium]